MTKLLQLLSIALAYLILMPNSGQAQSRTAGPSTAPRTFFNGTTGQFKPDWQANIKVSSRAAVREMREAPLFEQAQFDAHVPNLPYYDLAIPLNGNEVISLKSITAEGRTEASSSLFTQTMAESGLPTDTDWYPAQHAVVGTIETRRGVRYQHLRLYPLRVSRDGSRLQKAASLSYAVTRKPGPARKSAQDRRAYRPESVLRTGDWFKIGIAAEGLYKLDYAYLAALGINMSSLDPRSLRLHGNGGGMLPQVAGEYPYDDLEENAIFVSGEADGSFDQGDYIVFYGQSPHTWSFNNNWQRYVHAVNHYSDSTYYFLSYSQGPGKRIATEPSPGPGNFQPTSTTNYQFHDLEKFNPIKSGRLWLGETFDLTTEQTFHFPTPRLISGPNILATIRTCARSTGVVSKFTIREGNNPVGELAMPATNTIYGSYAYRGNYQTFDVASTGIGDGSIDLTLDYSHPLTSSVGYLDFIEVQYEDRLDMAGGNSFYFTATDNVGPGQVFAYGIENGGSAFQIWDVTDPLNVQRQQVSLSGNRMDFSVRADSMKRFVAWNGGAMRLPGPGKRIAPQNLHALPPVDYLILTPPALQAPANRLADFHRSHYGRSVQIVDPAQIFNEFSSGAVDPTALRDFIKMLYDRGLADGTAPRYVLLFGDGSYDYKNKDYAAAKNRVITYQSRKSQKPTTSYASDDYFALLDDGEGFWGERAAVESVDEMVPQWVAVGDTRVVQEGLDLGIGRIPVVEVEEAHAMVDKIIRYATNPAGFGDWRTKILLVADHKDADGNEHMRQADTYTNLINAANPCMNIDKFYMDNYTQESTASGKQYPDGKEALRRGLNEGALILNYTGHGGEVGWSNASILDISGINQMENGLHMPATITATCEFGRWDDPGRRSGGEIMCLKEDGGSIALFTTMRVVHSGPNFTLNKAFYREVFRYNDVEQRMPTMGEVFMHTKNPSWGSTVNNRNFSLLGDPGLILNYPELKAVVSSINGVAVRDTVVDTLAALRLVTVEGEVRDQQDNFLPNYQGNLDISVFDKASYFLTKRFPTAFFWQKNKVFKGSASVADGRFRFQFVVPADVSYEDNLPDLRGKISLYLHDGYLDGAGCNQNILIWGNGTVTLDDTRPPMLDLFMNDEKFATGGLVGPSPTLVAEIFDENGINMVGTGIGHELTAVLDGDENQIIVLNDYYAANKDSYQEGKIEYPFRDLEPGEHTLEVKVWDVANNSSEAEISFLVADDARMALGHVVNYPNPFTTNTKFFIEHNRNGSLLNVNVRIFTVAGRLVKTLEDSFFADGNLYCDLAWDGLDEYGDPLGRGAYVYQVQVRDETRGDQVSVFEKLVVLR